MTVVESAARILEQAIGLDPAGLGPAAIAAAVRRRVASLGLADEAGYAAVLGRDAGEPARLAEEVLVHESWFFRDGHPFELLGATLPRRWREHAPGVPLRILSAPCSAGEEPYSIAITLLAAGLPPAAFHIDAVDVSRRALDAARRAEYGPRAFRGSPAAWFERWVARAPTGRFTVDPAVRTTVTFHWANLLALESVVGAHRYDAILGRNAMIYLSRPARLALVETFWRLLAPHGLLIVGHAEAGPLLERRFRRHPQAGAFAFVRIDGPPAETLPPARGVPPPATAPGASRPAPAATPAPRSLPRAAAGAEPTTPRVPGTDALLVEARALADRGHYAEAAAVAARSLARRPTNPDTHHLLGVVCAARGQDRAARGHFERALYLEPAHEPSLRQLALLLETAGDTAGAARLRLRAARVRSST